MSDSLPIYDESGKQISEDDVDTSKGRLIPDKKFIKHHEATTEVAEVKHYRVTKVYFDDGTSYTPEGDNTDDHIGVDDDKNGIFHYIDQGENKVYHGMDLETVIDVEHADAKDAYDEYEDIQLYKLYTEEELTARKEAQEKQEKQQEFLTNGPTQLENNTSSIDDLYVTLADMVAGSDETEATE